MRVFITGGAGFIGCNLAAHHLKLGNEVTIYDNMSRPRTQHNLDWLSAQADAQRGAEVRDGAGAQHGADAQRGAEVRDGAGAQHGAGPRHGAALRVVRADVRDYAALLAAVTEAQPDLIVHLASQVAVTTSVKNPRDDFEINALGTFNVLEAARAQANPPAVFYASTNKVYGGLEHVRVTPNGTRYLLPELPDGISEAQPLDFHSPYGCSKGAGDQYVRDYARIYGLRTVVFRQSCIYGERQFGVEDQGWVAHFVIAAVVGRPITIYGDGKQVRDLLHVRDLIAAYDAAWQRLSHVQGEAFNVGGGAANTLSIWAEFGPLLEELAGRKIAVTHADLRPGDQAVFVSDNAKAMELLGWQPTVAARDGIRELWDWVNANRALFD